MSKIFDIGAELETFDPSEIKRFSLGPIDNLYFFAADDAFEVSLNNSPFVPFSKGRYFSIQDAKIDDKIKGLVIRNTSANVNTIGFYKSTGIAIGDHTFSINSNESVNVANAITIAELPDIEIANGQGVQVTPSANVTLNLIDSGSNQTKSYALKRYLKVINTGGATLDVKLTGADTITVPIGEVFEFPMLERGESYVQINVVAPSTTFKVLSVA